MTLNEFLNKNPEWGKLQIIFDARGQLVIPANGDRPAKLEQDQEISVPGKTHVDFDTRFFAAPLGL